MTRSAPIVANARKKRTLFQFRLFDIVALSAAVPPVATLIWMNYNDVQPGVEIYDNLKWYLGRWLVLTVAAGTVAIGIRRMTLTAIIVCVVAAVATFVNFCQLFNLVTDV